MAQMLLSQRIVLCQYKIKEDSHPSPNRQRIVKSHDVDLKAEGYIARIKEKFGKVEQSVSSYDTAWVAMVPSKGFPNKPYFPQCLDWVMENQHPDGSWGLHSTNPLLVKDNLSSTLACVLALQKWNVGDQLVQKGLDYIGSNKLAFNDKRQPSPIGFDIIFPGMVNQATEFGLNLPLDLALLDQMHHNRDLLVERGSGSCLAYIAEGLDGSYDWKKVMFHQRSNGSLFNSPATTAASLIHLPQDKSFEYLQSVLNIYGKAVPTIYPFDIYTHLCMVDTLQKLGIDRYFKYEIESVLDETYRCWQERNEDLFLDVACCAMAFRLLRMNGYETTSDGLAGFVNQEHFFKTVSLQFTNTETILELYRAAQITIFQEEPILEKIHCWTSTFLKQQLKNQEIYEERSHKEVEYALENTIFSSLERVENKKSIKLYNVDGPRMLKTSYRCFNIDNWDFLVLAQQDFNHCQAIHLEELEQLEQWVKDRRLDCLNFERRTLISNLFILAAVNFAPELADTRVAWVKHIIVLTFLDDMFDIDGSEEELHNIIELVEKWDGYSAVGFCSERTEILFFAIYDIINNEIAPKAFIKQGRCVKHTLIQHHVQYLKGLMREFEWWMGNSTPTVDEYDSNGCATIGMPVYLTIAFLFGPKLSEEVLRSEEYNSLHDLASRIGRLLNDYPFTTEREGVQRKVNYCSLLVNQRNGAITLEEAKTEMTRRIDRMRRELLGMVFQTKGSLVPHEIKNWIWNFSKLCHYVYATKDELRHPGSIRGDTKAVLFEPFNLPPHPNGKYLTLDNQSKYVFDG